MFLNLKEAKEVMRGFAVLEESQEDFEEKVLEFSKKAYRVNKSFSDEGIEKFVVENYEKGKDKIISPICSALIFLFEHYSKTSRGDKLLRKFARIVEKEMIQKGKDVSRKSAITFLSNLVLMGGKFGIRVKTHDLIEGTIQVTSANPMMSKEVRTHAANTANLLDQFNGGSLLLGH
jgi:hypothetical protein